MSTPATSSNATLTQEELDTKIYTLGSAIPLQAFQICTGIVFGLAIACTLARAVMRALTRRPLYWDDLFLAFGVSCLIGATVLLYLNTYWYYMLSASTLDPSINQYIPLETWAYLLEQATPMEYAGASLAWTTIFCVKASFLIISKQLISRLAWLNVYFWVVTAFTAASWVVLVSSPFINCPYMGFESAKCAISDRNTLYVAVNSLIAGLDILTDVLIASIPIIILARSKLDSKQKFVIGPFLSLSLVMIIFSVLRVSHTHDATIVDIVWLAFWQYLEAGIAVIVTSITTARTVFTARRERSTNKQSNPTRSWASFGSKNKQGRSGRASRILVDNYGEEDSVAMVHGDGMHGPATSGLKSPTRSIHVRETWDVSYSNESAKSDEALPKNSTR